MRAASLALLALVVACQGSGRDTPSAARALVERPTTVLVIAPRSDDTASVISGFISELQGDVTIDRVDANALQTVADLNELIQRSRPRCVVLVNNPTVELYRAWALTYPNESPPAAVVLMASFAYDTTRSIPNSVAILYEVPLVTAVQGLRSVVLRPFDRIGVLHRASQRSFIEQQRLLAQKEGVALEAEELSDSPSVGSLKRAMARLKARKIDGAWVLNDNQLLSAHLLESFWFPLVDDGNLPLIVGVKSFVRSDRHFGTYGIVPDSVALGTQAAGLVLELAERDWQTAGLNARQPISVRTVLDRSLAEPLQLREGRENADVVVDR